MEPSGGEASEESDRERQTPSVQFSRTGLGLVRGLKLRTTSRAYIEGIGVEIQLSMLQMGGRPQALAPWHPVLYEATCTTAYTH
jgi:hypothetical protein